VILRAASSLYGAAARWRRRWYEADPRRRRRLARPVVSVGNLRVGGSGKTPLVAHIARLLVDRGERPAILSRGYARRVSSGAVTVVSDGSRVLADLDHAGDEPLMLARALPGVPVLVGRDRYQSGRLAEERFGATLHLLDDGFQHVALERDVDLLALSEDDLTEPLLPAGRLREPLETATLADGLLVTAAEDGVKRVVAALGARAADIFTVSRTLGPLRWVLPAGPLPSPEGGPVVAVSGIARPERFHADLAAAGWRLAATMAFADHHPFTAADVERVAATLREHSASAVLTTEKDGVRLEAQALKGLRVAVVPLIATIAPPSFGDWLVERIRKPR
jgi:tetraacyldisaccharide 4'-kinase